MSAGPSIAAPGPYRLSMSALRGKCAILAAPAPRRYLQSRLNRQLVILGCSSVKVETDGDLPAISLYDGPWYQVLRSYLRTHHWPASLSVAVLSAKYGLIGGIAPIANYDQRMTRDRALELKPSVARSLDAFCAGHRHVDLILGKDYLHSIDLDAPRLSELQVKIAPGPIGEKLSRLRSLLYDLDASSKNPVQAPSAPARPLYFLPDWDDFLDCDFDFENDRFSADARSDRREQHSISLMRPHKLSDGVLVSLAQHLGGKGLLRKMGHDDAGALAPRPVRDHFRLMTNQWAFGDCGAFSYVAENTPTISTDQAISLYDLYEFDLGASVDHIPVPEVRDGATTRKLTDVERRGRVSLTKKNAELFLARHRERSARFIPVGTIQGLDAKSYANHLADYADMGYEYVALGGLVPRADADVLEVVRAVKARADKLRRPPAIHLFGIFRPKLQDEFRRLAIASFDSATYFRKAWLRSDQNYLGVDGEWYAAIRVPPTSDPRTLSRLERSGTAHHLLQEMERRAMDALHRYDRDALTLDACLGAVLEYDRHLERAELLDEKLVHEYRRTLTARPWRNCSCPMCKALGVDILIFRGLNRNKRRGAHNTLQLFRRVSQP